jgi:bifunctional UDP-N-acetylglucosamine pyrophosphorylase / glucosamine-1-phosphate N-acetyltransferase
MNKESANIKQDVAKTSKPRTAIILAAGKGTRMNSPLPKVLHPVAGQPMIANVIEACQQADIHDIRVVVGHGQNLVKAVVEPLGVHCYPQLQQLGTGDAVKSADINSIEGDVIILNGDHPLLEASDLKHFFKTFSAEKLDLAVVTAVLKHPKSFGRIVRHKGTLRAIVEARDASADTLKINEVNTGVYLCDSDMLKDYLPKIQNKNSKGEYYLTDLISLAIDDHCRVSPILGSAKVALGVNTQQELAHAARMVYRRKARQLMESGVLMLDPLTVYIEPSVEVAPGSVIHPGVHLKGSTKVGKYSVIEPGCFLVDTVIGEGVHIRAYSYFEKCEVKNKASVGPFARIRPETEIGEEAHVGNFVEMKKVKFGAGAKAGHLTYLGDAEIGRETNIGCGTITCNYAVDKKKYKTKIGERVFVGSDSQFIAPVDIGDDAVIASGSTITENVPAGALAVARSKQYTKTGYTKK